jgi:hypothetical protein
MNTKMKKLTDDDEDNESIQCAETYLKSHLISQRQAKIHWLSSRVCVRFDSSLFAGRVFFAINLI